MANDSKLDIKISTTADTAGVESTTDAFQKLDTTASKTANTIQASLAKTEIAEKSRTDSERQANQERAQSALNQISSRESAAKAAVEESTNLKELGRTTKEVSKVGEDLSRITEGLARGDLAGLAQAGRGVKDVLGTLAATAGGVLLPAIVAVGGAFTIFRSILGDITQTSARYYREAAAASDRYRIHVEENSKAAEIALKKQLDDIQKLAAAYDEVSSSIDKAYERQKKLNDSKSGLDSAKLDNDEKRALAAAKTPAQQDAVRQKFADQRLQSETKAKFGEFDTVDLQANVQKQAAEKAQQDSQAKNAELQAQVDAAKKDADEKTASAATLLSANGATGPTLQAQAEAKAAADNLKKIQANVEEEQAKNTEIFTKSQQQIDDATTSKQVNANNRNAYRESLTGKQLDSQASAKDLQKQLGEKTAALQPGDDAGIKEIQSLRAQIAAQKTTGNIYGNALNQDTANRSTAGVLADQRAAAGVGPAKVAGADGGAGSITKDGQEIKVTGANTVAELKKVSTTLADSSKAIDKATPAITKAASSIAASVEKNANATINGLQAVDKRVDAANKRIDEVVRQLQAKADQS